MEKAVKMIVSAILLGLGLVVSGLAFQFFLGIIFEKEFTYSQGISIVGVIVTINFLYLFLRKINF